MMFLIDSLSNTTLTLMHSNEHVNIIVTIGINDPFAKKPTNALQIAPNVKPKNPANAVAEALFLGKIFVILAIELATSIPCQHKTVIIIKDKKYTLISVSEIVNISNNKDIKN